jgi:hypothetical protein
MKIIIKNDNYRQMKREFLAKKYKEIFNKAFYKRDIKKTIFYGIKYITNFNYNKASFEEVYEASDIVSFLRDYVGYCNFYVMMNLFPIKKDFDGEKFECKDYFSTMDYLQDKDLSKMIFEYDIDDFFFNYYNSDILMFNVNSFMIFDRIAKLNGDETIMEKFAREFKIDTYLKVDDEHLINKNTLEVKKIIKKGYDNYEET